MSSKFSELPEDRRDAIDEELSAHSDIWDNPRVLKEKNRRGRIDGIDRFGLCAKCSRMWFIKGEYGILRATCEQGSRPMRLDSRRPVKDCTSYQEFNVQLGLYDMKAIAWIIDPAPRKVGF